MPCENCGNVTLPNGSNGLNGFNAFTVTTSSFILPAVSASVNIAVSASGQYTGIWASLGQVIYITDGTDSEYFEVTTAGTQTTIGVKNLGYVGTTVGNTFGSGSKVSPAGLQGAGTDGTNGTSLLGVSHAAATLNGLVYATFSTGTINVPAARMNATDDSLEIAAKFYFSTTSASRVGNIKVLINGVSITPMAGGGEIGLSKAFPYVGIKIFVTYTGASTANIRVEAYTSDYGFGSYSSEQVLSTGVNATYENIAIGGLSWSSSPNIIIQGIVTDTNDVIKLGFMDVISIKKV